MEPVIWNFDHKVYDFHTIVQNIFQCDNLLLLHELCPGITEVAEPGKDQNTKFHKMFYDACKPGSSFDVLYKKFVRQVWRDLQNDIPAVYQTIPTFRVQLPSNQAVGGRSHRDRDYNHPDGEHNFLVPLTSMSGSSSIFTETSPGLKDFRFIDLHPGQVLKFDGNNCEHGNIPNVTGYTRVSFDFRVLPLQYYNENNTKKSVAHGVEFKIGEYYSAL